jgi:ssDNA thymidine ADP-ribosyltransferase, DarT
LPRRPKHPPGRPKPWTEGELAAYHITHVDNLASIVACGELSCDRRCAAAERNPIGIAHTDLKEKRARKAVAVAAGGTLADYVPFYYAPRSPMLYSIATGWVAEYGGSQEEILHLVCSVDELAKSRRFVITDRHPITPLAEQSDDLDALDELDWGLMRAQYWSDTDEDGERKFRRQAEFLVYRSVPVTSIRLVGAMTRETASRAAESLSTLPDPPPVIVRRNWYY